MQQWNERKSHLILNNDHWSVSVGFFINMCSGTRDQIHLEALHRTEQLKVWNILQNV